MKYVTLTEKAKSRLEYLFDIYAAIDNLTLEEVMDTVYLRINVVKLDGLDNCVTYEMVDEDSDQYNHDTDCLVNSRGVNIMYRQKLSKFVDNLEIDYIDNEDESKFTFTKKDR